MEFPFSFPFYGKYSAALLGNGSFSLQTTCRSRGQMDEWSKQEKDNRERRR